MTSQELYLDIKENDCNKAYNYLKKRFIRYIQRNYTSDCLATAEDFFSNSFLKIYERIQANKLQNTSNINGYFLIICKHEFLNTKRRNKVMYKEQLEEASMDILHEIELDFELPILTLDLINQLPKQLRNICQKIYVEGKAHKEISKELNISYQNIRKYQYKALQLMKSKTPMDYIEYLYAA